jgi:hypothetical protein
MENVIRIMSFIFGSMKNTPAPLKRELEYKKEVLVFFQNYWYEDDSKFQLSKHKFSKATCEIPLLKPQGSTIPEINIS